VTAIRVATIADCEVLAAVHVTAWQESFRGLLPDIAFEGMTIPKRMERWQQVFAAKPTFPVYVAEEQSQAIGFAQGGRARDDEALGQEMQLYAIYLLSSAKRRGVGTKLLQAVVSDFLVQGASSACVWTLRDAQPARRFYESVGAQLAAEKLERRPGYDRVLVAYIWPNLERSFSNQGTAPSRFES
jgi:L-amino acid N-acyltransferase YncA